jgi:flagellin-like protein
MVNSLTHRLFRSKKGISPILATLLLVVIAVAAIVVTYAWVMTYMARTTGQAGVVLNVANVRFYGNGTAGTSIYIDIQDTGTSDTTITQLYVGTSDSTMDNQTITPLPIAAGTTQRITVNYSWQTFVGYHFRVITSSGLNFPFTWQAPSSYYP